MESVQRYFTKRICERCNVPFTSYKDRLYKLNLKSLKYCRKEKDLLMVYKIIHSLVDLRMEDFFKFYTSPYNTRRHRLCIDNGTASTEEQRSQFAHRVVRLWNSLPENVVMSTSITMFKARLRKVDIDKLDTS